MAIIYANLLLIVDFKKTYLNIIFHQDVNNLKKQRIACSLLNVVNYSAMFKQNVVRYNYSFVFKKVVKTYSLLQNCSLLQ